MTNNNDDNSISVEDGLRMAAEQFAVMDTPTMAKLMRDAADQMDQLKYVIAEMTKTAAKFETENRRYHHALKNILALQVNKDLTVPHKLEKAWQTAWNAYFPFPQYNLDDMVEQITPTNVHPKS